MSIELLTILSCTAVLTALGLAYVVKQSLKNRRQASPTIKIWEALKQEYRPFLRFYSAKKDFDSYMTWSLLLGIIQYGVFMMAIAVYRF